MLSWDLPQWNDIYADLPSRQSKVSVPDKSIFVCCEDETRLLEPTAVQRALDRAAASFSDGRCFLRPSGTEDVVRVYAEACTQSDADTLALAALEVIQAYAAGDNSIA